MTPRLSSSTSHGYDRGALHDAELRVEREDRVDRALDVLERRRRRSRGTSACRTRRRGGAAACSTRSPEAILNAGMPSSARKSALGSSNTVREERDALLARELAQLEPVGGGQLERLAMLAVRRAEASARCRRARRRARACRGARLSRFWSLTASTPHSFAARTSAFAFSRSPWWLCPISAMTYAGPSRVMPLAVDDELAARARWY